VTRLFENDRVSVSKERFPGTARGDDFHAHPTDTVIVYLSGGEMDGTTGRAPSRARRGQVDVLPAYTLHRFTNLGFDPIEFIVIHPK
jgi:quercetin dioxygenase-like cupin family protein